MERIEFWRTELQGARLYDGRAKDSFSRICAALQANSDTSFSAACAGLTAQVAAKSNAGGEDVLEQGSRQSVGGKVSAAI